MQRKQLAVLTLLGSSRKHPLTRDKICAYLWPNSDPERSRHRLADTLYGLRQALGQEVVSTQGENLRLESAAIAVDVWEFEQTVERGELARAERLYRGPFLDGFHLGIREFQDWVDIERERLGRTYRRVLERLAEAAEHGEDWKEAARWWCRRAEADRYDSRVAARLVMARARSGNRAGALRGAEDHARVLKEELGIAPPDLFTDVVERIREIGSIQGLGPRHVQASESSRTEVVAGAVGPLSGASLRRPSRSLNRVAIAALFAVVGGTAVLGSLLSSRSDAPPGSAKPVLAILPFTNQSAVPDGQVLTRGIHDELLTNLARLDALRVISRNSVSEYVGRRKSLREIGQELGVDAVVEGSVEWTGDQVRVTAQLVDAETDVLLWSESYDRPSTIDGLSAIQADLARRIATQLEARITRAEQKRLASRPTDDPEAYHAYLQGLGYMRRSYFRAEPNRAAARAFEHAVKLDPQFAPAHARLGAMHMRLFWYGHDRTEARLARAKTAIDRALAIDSRLWEARFALGLYHYYGHLAYDEALEEFERVLQMHPGNVDALRGIGAVRRRQGRIDEAAEYMERALELDPRSGDVLVDLNETYRLARRFEEAERSYDRSIALNPDRGVYYAGNAHLYLAWGGQTEKARETLRRGEEILGSGTDAWMTYAGYFADLFDKDYPAALDRLRRHRREILEYEIFYHPKTLLSGRVHLFMGDVSAAHAAYDSARIHLEERRSLRPDDPQVLGALGLALAGLGREEEAVATVQRAEELMPPSREAWAGSYRVEEAARVYVRVGDLDKALDRLEYLLTHISKFTPAFIKLDPEWEPLRGHPRYRDLVEG